MQQDEEEAPPEVTNNGPKIKMNRIRRNKAKPGAAADTKTDGEKATTKVDTEFSKAAEKASSGPGGFTEQDIEFMKKAI